MWSCRTTPFRTATLAARRVERGEPPPSWLDLSIGCCPADRVEQVNVALENIRAELEENLANARRARTNHRAMRDSVGRYVGLRQAPPPQVYLGGIFDPATTHANRRAWPVSEAVQRSVEN